MIEKDVERRLCALARRHGGVALKWTSPGTMGVPDRLVFLPGGRLYLVEVKRPGGRPRESQKAIHRRLGRLGWPVYVVDDADAFFASLPEPRIEGEKADEERGAADADDDAGMRQGGDPAGEDGAEAGDAEQDADAHGSDGRRKGRRR